MKVPDSQFRIFSLLTVCAILWLLLLTCYREYWGFWQIPEDYRFLTKEYPVWVQGIHLGFLFIDFVLCRIDLSRLVLVAFQRITESQGAKGSILLMTLLMGMTLGVLCANNLINFLDSGQLHGKTHLQSRP